MVLLKQYTKDDRIFTPVNNTTRRFGMNRMIEVWWDPPLPSPPKVPYGYKIGEQTLYKYAMAPTVKHDMVFACTIHSRPALALIDTGASDTFVSAKALNGTKVITPNTRGSYVLCAGNQPLHLKGTIELPLRVGSYMQRVEMNVVDELMEGVDLILGTKWLRNNKVKINYAKMNCTIRTFGNARHTVTPLQKGHDYDPEREHVALLARALHQNEQTCEVISPKRAVKALKRGADYLLLNLRQVERTEHPPPEQTEHCLNNRTSDGKECHRPVPSARDGRFARNGGSTSRGGQLLMALNHASPGDAPSPAMMSVLHRRGLNVTMSGMNGLRGGCKRHPSTKRPAGSAEPVKSVGTVERMNTVADSPHELYRNALNEHEPGLTRNPSTTPEPQSPESIPVEGLVPPDRIAALLQKYKHVFSEDLPTGLPPDRGIGHTIRLEEGATPPYRRHKRMSPAEYELCEKYLQDLLNKGLITPSTSPFGAPIMIIPKPKGGHRVVCDWRLLNKVTVKNKYPLPRIDETLDRLAGATVFTSLDLNSGYFQIRISAEDAHKTAFSSPIGHYEFKVLGQGLCNSHATFQSVMNKIFAPHLHKFVVVYLDDVMIFSKDPESHEQHLEQVLKLLDENKFLAKPSKCEFNKPEVKFLGHVVGRNGLKVDSAKIQVVKDWPVPTTLKHLRSFLGLTNYFRKFIQGYSCLTAPLTSFMKKGVDFKSTWTDTHTAIIEQLREALTTAPVLTLPDFSQPFEVVSDASLLGTGAVLMQNEKVIAYTSSKYIPAELNYTTGEQELLGVVKAMQEWRCYLEGSDSILVTDHNPLTFLQEQPTLSRRQARWMEYLARFHYTWKYRPGRLNVADPVSRNPMLGTAMLYLCAVGRPNKVTSITEQIAKGYAKDSFFTNPENLKTFTREGRFWLKDGRIVVPDVDNIRKDIMTEMHVPPYSGHVGTARTIQSIVRTFYWRGLYDDVGNFVHACHDCQRNKPSNRRPGGLLQSVEIPDRLWGCVTSDLITHLPTTRNGKDAIALFVDKLSKMVRLAATTTTVNAEGYARLFVDNVFRSHGLPSKIISDRDARFTGHFLTAVTKSLGIRQAFSTSFHPQTDGQTERTNRTLEDMLRHYVNPYQNDWDEYLTVVEFAINNSWQTSIQNTPFHLNYGQHPHTPLSLQVEKDVRVPRAQTFVQNHHELLNHAKTCLQAAQARQKAYADRTRRDVKDIRVNELVLLSTKNMKFRNKETTPKLMPKFVGPFKITKVIGPVDKATGGVKAITAVKLDLPPLMKIHDLFHVSLVKPYISGGGIRPPEPLLYEADGSARWEVEALIADRVRTHVNGKPHVIEYLVRWAGFGPEHDTWEPSQNIHAGLIAAYKAKVAQQPERPRSTRAKPKQT